MEPSKSCLSFGTIPGNMEMSILDAVICYSSINEAGRVGKQILISVQGWKKKNEA